MKKKQFMLQMEDGSEVDLKEVFSEAAQEMLKESGIIGEDGKVALKNLPSEVKSELQQKQEAAENAANFVKFITVPQAKHKQYGVKAIDTTTGSMGYTVPTELANEILKKKQKINAIRGRAFQFEMAGKFDLPTEGTGVTGYWVAENAAITESNPTTGKASLDDWYLAALVKAPWKLLQTSAFTIVNYIATLSAKALAETEETAFVGGDGSSKPTGLRQASVGSVAQAGANFAYSDMINLFFELNQKYRRNAVFMTSPAGMKLLANLKDSQNRPIFPPGTPLEAFLNKPLIESDDIPSNLGAGTNETEVWLVDLFYYWIKDGQAMEMATQDVIENLQTKIVLYEAVDGKLTLTDAAKKLTGVK
jgi:HK97 family phage major capsid protein